MAVDKLPQLGAGFARDFIMGKVQVVEGAEIRRPGEVQGTNSGDPVASEAQEGQAPEVRGVGEMVYVPITEPSVAEIEREAAVKEWALAHLSTRRAKLMTNLLKTLER